MIDSLRRRIAALSYIIVQNKKANFVFDYNERKYFNFITNRNEMNITIYDSSVSRYFSGRLPNIYDYDENSFISVKANENKLSIYSFKYRTSFIITVNGNNVSVFDFKYREFYNYIVN